MIMKGVAAPGLAVLSGTIWYPESIAGNRNLIQLCLGLCSGAVEMPPLPALAACTSEWFFRDFCHAHLRAGESQTGDPAVCQKRDPWLDVCPA